MSDNQNKKSYSVGYKKPPKHGQFKKGQSGNPRGRPRKAAQNINWPLQYRNLLLRALNQSMKIKEGDRVFTTTKLDVILRRLIEGAIKGNTRAGFRLLQELERHLKEAEDMAVRMQLLANELEEADAERAYQKLLKKLGKTEEEYPCPWPLRRQKR